MYVATERLRLRYVDSIPVNAVLGIGFISRHGDVIYPTCLAVLVVDHGRLLQTYF